MPNLLSLQQHAKAFGFHINYSLRHPAHWLDDVDFFLPDHAARELYPNPRPVLPAANRETAL